MLLDHNEPTNYEEVMMSPDSAKWLEAMKSKMGSMYENKVCAGEHSNFKKNPTNTQDHGDA